MYILAMYHIHLAITCTHCNGNDDCETKEWKAIFMYAHAQVIAKI